MRVAMACLVLVAGCDRIFGLDPPASIDGALADGPFCYGTIHPICLAAEPLGLADLSGSIDTSAGASCVDAPLHPALCVVAHARIRINAMVQAGGARPLVLLATETLTVTAVLDASSRAASAEPGAGADDPSCPSPPGGASGGVGAGGAGGSYSGTGGKGGDANAAAAMGPVAPMPTPRLGIRGGCSGGAGGATGGEGGSSGGAVYLIAGRTLGVAGVINASGAGGEGGGVQRGGGGGGSGGLIALDAPTLELGGCVLLASGGGGGGGGSGVSPAGPGGSGGEASPGAPMVAAVAGAGGTDGGSGGGGSVALDGVGGTDGIGGATGGGGGGGGGGAGFIVLASTVLNGSCAIVPPP